ncbi:MAG: SIMPL domain-containing protein, partial [Dehalococcoidales bacterium]|nr:SIMPL domain-containing protein [Dehalococcoidales bacterium]
VKKIGLAVIGLVLLATMIFTVGCATDNTIGTTSQQTGIWVNGTGKVYAVPDIAQLTLGVEAQAATVAQAQAQANQAMAEVVAALKAAGIAEEDIQTQYYNIYEVTRWDYDKEESIITAYRVTNTVTATIRDIETVGAVIDGVVVAGGDYIRINGINFSVEDPNIYYAQAREQAVNYAKAKAEQMASLTGVTLGKMFYITESSYMPSGNYVDIRAEYAASDGGSTSISAGQLEITTTVTIAYNIG